ncbi:hypothetical protein HJFPF1_11022 [Paramyrothecium foliicola]|nr:hypothetical protein HJFPF1_11022 [Paramyrothecium foliicola]
MSGLEPVVALSLACNILQLIGTGREIVRVAKQVYQDGFLSPALTEGPKILDDLSSRIQSATATPSTAKPKAEEKLLFDLSEKCQRDSRALREEVNFLNGLQTKDKLFGAAMTAFRTMWRKKRLEKLEQQLEESENLLNTGILTAIFEQSSSHLPSLDADLKAFILEYRTGSAGATDLMRKHVTGETERNRTAIKLHVTQTANEAERSLKSHMDVATRGFRSSEQETQMQAKRNRLLDSLKFDRMNERKNQVMSAHHKTFTWMFQDGSDVDGSPMMTGTSDYERLGKHFDDWEPSYVTISWDSFSNWLRSTDSIYWISGKPGSGKITLMKYLIGQPQTQTFLDLWRPDAILISHFFWRPGTVMQQSIKGLFCSLLHQLLFGEPKIVDHVLRTTADLVRKDSETDWSTEELQTTLLYVISCYSRPVAIFLDGLDEVLPQEGVLRLLNIVDQLRQTGKTKLCLGSRRETLLHKRLCNYPQLRLEQLNRVDLWRYGKDHIIIPSDYDIVIPYRDGSYYPVLNYPRETPPNRDEFRDWLVRTLVKKAEGVFLWLCLTVTTVIKALNQDETFEDLEARIQSLPSDLADLYADMWNRVNDDGMHLRVRAASYLQLALACSGSIFEYPLNLFIMMVATNPEKAEKLLQADPSELPSVASLIDACEKTRRDTMNRCVGLLVCPSLVEVHPVKSDNMYPWYGEEYDRLIPYVSHFPVFSFLHRTARDFLTDTEAGRRILSYGEFPGSLSRLKLLEGRLVICQLFRTPILYATDGKDIGASVHSNEVGHLLADLLYGKEEDASTRQEIPRLLRLCEKLFNQGQLFSPMTVPPNTMQLEQEPRHPTHHVFYDSTVRGQHEFLTEVAYYGRYDSGIWNHLLPLIMDRNLDENTKCQLLVHACTFSGPWHDPFVKIDCRLNSIRSLLDWGASPYQQSINRKQASRSGSPLIAISATPLKAWMTSVWKIGTSFIIDENLRRKLFGLTSLFITKGADPHEEIHVAIELQPGQISFKDLWDEFYPSKKEGNFEATSTEFGHILVILAYPASALLAHILQIWKLAEHSQLDWIPKICAVPESGVGKGRPICIVDLGEIAKDKTTPYTPPLFLSRGIFNLGPETDVEKHFLGLVRLVEDNLQGVVAKGKIHFDEVHGSCISHVSVPSDIYAEIAVGLKRLKSTTISATERCKQLRTRLGVITPLEEPEWQGSSSF